MLFNHSSPELWQQILRAICDADLHGVQAVMTGEDDFRADLFRAVDEIIHTHETPSIVIARFVYRTITNQE